jgi:hypothetical protein
MSNLVEKIENWIDATLESHCEKMVPCTQLSPYFEGYFSEKLLSSCCYAVVPELPKPDLPALREAGFGSFIDDEHAGITYKNCYFIKADQEDNLYLHLHELVHVCQWRILGAEKFILTYMQELHKYGYEDAPLEQVAKAFEYNYATRSAPINVLDALRDELA